MNKMIFTWTTVCRVGTQSLWGTEPARVKSN